MRIIVGKSIRSNVSFSGIGIVGRNSFIEFGRIQLLNRWAIVFKEIIGNLEGFGFRWINNIL